jgi:uncharacterized membrane protein
LARYRASLVPAAPQPINPASDVSNPVPRDHSRPCRRIDNALWLTHNRRRVPKLAAVRARAAVLDTATAISTEDRGPTMGKNRLEAFSDGVIAIIITIMVLELKVPHGGDLAALVPLFPVLCAYVLSFIYVGIYWNNHHHLMHAVQRVNGSVLWANLHLLFWLSLLPFTTNWMGENQLQPLPTALYGFVLFMASVAHFILAHALTSMHGANAMLERALGADRKGKLSVVLYLVAMVSAFWQPWLAAAIYALVAVAWLVPDSRVENVVAGEEH